MHFNARSGKCGKWYKSKIFTLTVLQKKRKNMKKLPFIKLVSSMAIFGTIGAFVRFISAERGFIASVRGIVGAIFLLLFALLIGKKPSLDAIKKNLPILLISGACIGINWILLFESYSYTTIAASTLCYYMAPVIVILASPFILRERITLKKGICALIAIVGALLVSGILESGFGESGVIGCLLALGAAVFYAAVILLNKKLHDISPYDMTIVQLGTAGLTILPYTLFVEQGDILAIDLTSILLLVVVAIVHTGAAYALYFSSIQELSTDTVAIFSYLDPVVAVIISLMIGEYMSMLMGLGAVLIIIALVVSELNIGKGSKKTSDIDENY